MLVCGCSKESHGDQNHVTCPVESDWSGLVKAHPLFVGFPEFTGRIQNPLYSDLGDGEETIVFIVNCKEDVATDYCKRLASFGFTKDDSWKYIQRSLTESPIFSPALIRQAILDLIFT